jgi:ribosomal protein S18 acetylase RimI-like enzyme
MKIRAANTNDLQALYSICLQTADSGRDATPLVRHKDIIGDLYAVPYLMFEPESCFVVDKGGDVVGYIVGVTDTACYTQWLNTTWLAELRQRYTLKAIAKGNLEQLVLSQIHAGVEILDFLVPYPSHFHIDLLPEAQGQGLGRQLIQIFGDTVKGKGSNGIHLGVSSDNLRALGFYNRLGFQEIQRFEDAVFLSLSL